MIDQWMAGYTLCSDKPLYNYVYIYVYIDDICIVCGIPPFPHDTVLQHGRGYLLIENAIVFRSYVALKSENVTVEKVMIFP